MVQPSQKTVDRKIFSRDEKAEIMKTSGGKCSHCGKQLNDETMTVEHIFPIAKGGNHSKFNLIALCEKCNNDKSNQVYCIRDYYKYIDDEFVDAINNEYIENVRRYAKLTRRLMIEDARLYKYVSPQMVGMLMQMRSKTKKKVSETLAKAMINYRYELAYEADAEDIARFVIKNNERKGNKEFYFDNDYLIIDLIKEGQVYVMRAPDKSIKAVIGVINNYSKKHRLDLPFQIENLVEVEEKHSDYILVLYELADNLTLAGAEIPLDLLLDFSRHNSKLMVFNRTSDIHPLLKSVKSKKIFNMPFSIKGMDGYLQCLTGEGERELYSYIERVDNGEQALDVMVGR